jgi:hypothetical protein
MLKIFSPTDILSPGPPLPSAITIPSKSVTHTLCGQNTPALNQLELNLSTKVLCLFSTTNSHHSPRNILDEHVFCFLVIVLL